jgi:3-methylcrotonyl-CoA carboxylase alpha subunit
VTRYPPFSKLLIANRGEIAIRVIQTARRLGIGTIAVYSTADAAAPHVSFADEAYLIGGGPASESYLNVDAILAAAGESGADAVHPGYGFLAENATFAHAVRDGGLVWVGPPAEVIALLGNKVASKEMAHTVGVPVVPGYSGEDQTVERLLAEAAAIGYPVMVKAAAGGGGRGMRAVFAAEELPMAVEGARREAKAAFSDDSLFLEKLLGNPRHIEIQVLCDAFGGGVYLGERDCSIQRRHQKVLEEAPSPVLTRDLRMQIGVDALRISRAAGYVNAGTVEFLFDSERYYFLEMNTRIQVEHPVTEMVTGIDLVEQQLLIAAGAHLNLSQGDVKMRGHAIEARLYAEDPEAGFLPSSGRVEVFEPAQSPGVRNDVGIEAGMDVGTLYDPMLAKVIAHGEDRPSALARLADALRGYRVTGLTTNLDFLRWLVEHPEVQAGRADIGFVDREWRGFLGDDPPPEVLAAAALWTMVKPGARDGSFSTFGKSDRPPAAQPWLLESGWRHVGIARTIAFRSTGEGEALVTVRRLGLTFWQLQCADVTMEVEVLEASPGRLALRQGDHVMRFSVAAASTSSEIEFGGLRYRVEPAGPPEPTGTGRRREKAAESMVTPMPGTIVKVSVQEGQRIAAHEPLVVLEAMKMEHVVEAPHEGIVARVLVSEGDLVAAGTPVVRLEVL